MRKWLIALALAWLFPLSATANTPAEENGGAKVTVANIPGELKLKGIYLLCSDFADGDTDCTPFDLSKIGLFKVAVVHLFNDGFGFTCTGGACIQQTGGTDSCTATPAFEITTAPFKDAVGGADAPPTSARAIAGDFTVDDSGEVERVITLDLTQTPLDRYLFTHLSGDAANCNDLDIALYVYDYDED